MSFISPYLESQLERFPQLPHARTVELVRRAQAGDKASKDLVVNSNLRLVVHHAQRYKTFLGFELDEFVDEGVIGLMRAVDKFDPDAGYQFSTFASNGIKKALNRFLANNRYTIRMPVHVTEELYKIRKAEAELENHSQDDLAEATGLSVEKIAHLVESDLLIKGVDSLDRFVGEEQDTTLGALVADKHIDVFEEVSEKIEAEELRAAMVAALPEYWLETLEMIYFEEMSHAEIAAHYGVSVQFVYELRAKAVDLLYRYYQGETTAKELDGKKKMSKRILSVSRQGFKKCNTCGHNKRGSEFGVRTKDGKVGLQSACKECKSEIDKKYAAAKVAKKMEKRKTDPTYRW